MPFKNKDQIKACFAANDPNWDCHKWAKETPNLKSLPEHPKHFKGASMHMGALAAHKARHGIKC